MPYPLHVKRLAYKLDPECWDSYSGAAIEHKRAMDVRRSASLTKAAERYRTPKARIVFPFLRPQPGAQAKFFAKVMFTGEQAKTFDEICNTALRNILRERLHAVITAHGKNCAAEAIKRYGAKVSEIDPADYGDVIRHLDHILLTRTATIRAKIAMSKSQASFPPMKISMMLHFAGIVGPFAPEERRKSEAYVQFVRELLRDGMIVRPTKRQRIKYPGWAYQATDKGRAYVSALTEVPMPVRANPEWVMPK